MRRSLVVSTFGGLVLALWLAAWSVVGSAERSPELLTGELWQTMSLDSKVAFVWGIGQGLSGKPINDVIHQVDSYYQTHPDQLNRPVVDVVYHAVVLPALKKSLP